MIQQESFYDLRGPRCNRYRREHKGAKVEGGERAIFYLLSSFVVGIEFGKWEKEKKIMVWRSSSLSGK